MTLTCPVSKFAFVVSISESTPFTKPVIKTVIKTPRDITQIGIMLLDRSRSIPLIINFIIEVCLLMQEQDSFLKFFWLEEN